MTYLLKRVFTETVTQIDTANWKRDQKKQFIREVNPRHQTKLLRRFMITSGVTAFDKLTQPMKDELLELLFQAAVRQFNEPPITLENI